MSNNTDAFRVASKIAGYEKASAIIWLILGILQVLIAVEIPFFIIIGVWNIIVSVSRFKMIDRIRSLDPKVPFEYEGIVGLVIFGIVNLLLGAIIGIAGIVVDFYVRDQILKNRNLFDPDYQFDVVKTTSNKNTENAYQLLMKLGELKAQKLISEEEFAAEKAKLLDR